MATFDWSGRTAKGADVSGTMEATSKDELIDSLQKQNIILISVTEQKRGDMTTPLAPSVDRPSQRILGRLVLILVLFTGAILLSSTSRGSFIHCQLEEAGGDYVCSVETNIAGFYPLYSEELKHARAARSEESNLKSRRTRVVVSDELRNIATEWMAYPIISSKTVAEKLSSQLEARESQSFETRQVESPPIYIAVVLAFVAICMCIAIIRKFTTAKSS